ncbi:AfsR/SARP family transcriptional regulator, partial [Catenulispora pinisilvae]
RTRLTDPRFPTPEPPLPGTLQAARRAHLRASSASPQSIEDRIDETTSPQHLNGDEHTDFDFDTPGTDTTIVGTGKLLDEEDGAFDLYFDGGQDSDHSNTDDDDSADEDDVDGGEPDYGLGTRYTAPLVPGSISAAERGGAEVPLVPTGLGLGLIGPGAAGAARAIAAGVLSAGAPDRTSDLARLIIPAADLAALLGVEETALPQLTAGLPELIVTRGLAEALAEAEVHALFRTRLLEEYEVNDLDALNVEHPDEEDCPPLVVMASPTRPLSVRLTALIGSAAPLRITAVLLGGWPSATAFVEHDGTATGPAAADWAGTRLWNLSPTGLGDVITLLARAAGHQPEITGAAAVTDPWPQLEPVKAPYQAGTAASDNSWEATVTALPVRTVNVAQPAVGQPTIEDASEARQEPTEAESPIAPVTVLPVRSAAPAAEVADAGAAGTARAAVLLTAWEQHPVQITVLGGLRISVAGQPVAGLRTQARVLAALLAIKGPAGATAAQIDAMCWPDAGPADADRVTKWRKDGITSLRTRLNEAAGRQTSAYIALDRATGRYSLDPDLVATDVSSLAALTAAARTAQSSEDRLALLAAASPLCAGILLDGELGDVFAWADDYAPTFADQQTAVLGRLAALAADAGLADQALGALEQAAAFTEDAEALYRQMFDILAAAGRHAEIPGKLRILETFTDSLGADVSAETRQAAADAMRTRQPRPKPSATP